MSKMCFGTLTRAVTFFKNTDRELSNEPRYFLRFCLPQSSLAVHQPARVPRAYGEAQSPRIFGEWEVKGITQFQRLPWLR